MPPFNEASCQTPRSVRANMTSFSESNMSKRRRSLSLGAVLLFLTCNAVAAENPFQPPAKAVEAPAKPAAPIGLGPLEQRLLNQTRYVGRSGETDIYFDETGHCYIHVQENRIVDDNGHCYRALRSRVRDSS